MIFSAPSFLPPLKNQVTISKQRKSQCIFLTFWGKDSYQSFFFCHKLHQNTLCYLIEPFFWSSKKQFCRPPTLLKNRLVSSVVYFSLKSLFPTIENGTPLRQFIILNALFPFSGRGWQRRYLFYRVGSMLGEAHPFEYKFILYHEKTIWHLM